MTERVSTILAGGHAAFRDGIAATLGVPVHRLPADALDQSVTSLREVLAPGPLYWVHLVPSAAGTAEPVTAEASLLIRSAGTAQAAADAAGAAVLFVALIPMPGMFCGPDRLACDLALTAMSSLMRAHIGRWSREGRRIVGIVYGGIRGNEIPAQRPLEEIRLRTPMGALGTFEQLGDALRFVASGCSSYVTGTFLRVDGGCDAYSWVYPSRTI